MNTKHSGLVAFLGLAGLVAGCATSPARTSRGMVAASAPGARAIVAGPVDVRAYSEFSGGEIYLVTTSTGSDADCTGTPEQVAAIAVPGDKVISVAVPVGKTACLRTRVSQGYELLWRTQPGRETDQLLASTTKRIRT